MSQLERHLLAFVTAMAQGLPPDDLVTVAMEAVDTTVREAVLAEREVCAAIAARWGAGVVAEEIRARP